MITNDQIEQIKKYIDEIINTEDNLTYEQLQNNKDYLDEIKDNEFAKSLSMKKFNEILKGMANNSKEPKEPKEKLNEETVETEIIIKKDELKSIEKGQNQRKEIIITNAYNAQPRSISDTDIIVPSTYQSNIMPFDEKKFETILKNAEKMIVPSHIKYLKFGRFLSSEFYIDVVCTCLNIQVKFDYTYDTIPITNELKLTAYCSVYDSSRNVAIAGVAASEFLIKTEKSDEEEGKDETIRDDHQVIETAQTRSLRRAMLYIVPSFIREQILDMIEQRYYPEIWNKKKKNVIQNTPKTTNNSTNSNPPSTIPKKTTRASALKQIR